VVRSEKDLTKTLGQLLFQRRARECKLFFVNERSCVREFSKKYKLVDLDLFTETGSKILRLIVGFTKLMILL